MRISDWSSDVCSSDLGQVSHFGCERRLWPGIEHGIDITQAVFLVSCVTRHCSFIKRRESALTRDHMGKRDPALPPGIAARNGVDRQPNVFRLERLTRGIGRRENLEAEFLQLEHLLPCRREVGHRSSATMADTEVIVA